MPAKTWDYECAVIGGGPGGLVSALYLRRFRRSVVLIQEGKPRAAWIPETHNLMGFPQGISGKQILERLNTQVNQLEIRRIEGKGVLEQTKRGFQVHVNQESMNVRTAILATGIEDLQPSIPNLSDLREKGLLRYCPICDAYEHRDALLAALIQDQAGMKRALFLKRYSSKLTFISCGVWRPSLPEIQKVKVDPISFLSGKIVEMRACASPLGLRIILEGQEPIFCQAAYIELGNRVRDDAFKNLKELKRTRAGHIVVDRKQRTSLSHLYAVGDCTDQIFQLSVAAGQAAIAATALNAELRFYGGEG